jgi:hypothetical protein
MYDMKLRRAMWVGIAALVCSTQGPSAVAGLFGPGNFEECILENMKGITSDSAAKLIALACAKKFPKSLPKDFEERFGERGRLNGHVYEKGPLDNVIRMEGARVRLLTPGVIKSLVTHLKVRDDMLQKAVEKEIEAFREESLAEAPAIRAKHKDKIKAAEKTLDESRAGYQALTKQLGELKSDLAADKKAQEDKLAAESSSAAEATKADNARLAELRAEKDRLTAQLDKKKVKFAAAQAEADRKFEIESKALEDKLAARKSAERAMRSEFKVSRQAIEKKADHRIAEAERQSSSLASQIRKAERDLEAARQTRAEVLRDAYVRHKITVSSFYGNEYGDVGDMVPCFTVFNTGALAIRKLTIGVKFKGRPTREIGFDVNEIMSLSPFVSVVDYARNFDKTIQPLLKNKYDEDIHGLPPGAKWPKRGCASLSRYGVKGDVQRALERVGGFDADGWSFYLIEVDLANAESLQATKKPYRSEKVWTYRKQTAFGLFAKQVEAATPTMEPAKRKKRLADELKVARATVAKAKSRKERDLAKYDKDNETLLAGIVKQRRAAEVHAAALKRPVIDDPEYRDMQARFEAVGAELGQIETAVSERSANVEALSRDFDRTTGAQQAHIDGLATRVDAAAKTVAAREKDVAEARAAQRTFEETLAALESRRGKAWDGILKTWGEDYANHAGDAINKQWFQGLRELLDKAPGSDARVDPNGAYKFTNLRLGPYVVYVHHVHRRTPVLWLERVTVGKETTLELGNFNSVVNPDENIKDVQRAIGRLDDPAS